MNFSSAEALTEMGHSGTTQLVDTIKIKVPSSVHGKKKKNVIMLKWLGIHRLVSPFCVDCC